ncbi:nuclear transport factor 2 family protein [Rehaibacterium terrae]|jgi:ketosteroid isomerase-like protein|uniref:Ketosteroid isomerase-like protein n=1 Tax=Rehaibacterium terrae TaxID=1341696 RepID=A0A7W7Y0T8_9GAMM|nr:nuclear transport factor 2 family protein [Rehaibacterium terrae]MBB5016013.1 ketosteroid isomerase-like protein [Rehaibacterium terrae]
MQRLVLAALCGLLAPVAAFAECSPADRAQLEKLDRDWGEAGHRGDRAFLQSLYADDYRDLTPGRAQDKQAAIAETLAEAERNRGNPGPLPQYDFYLIHCTPTSATITHRVTTTHGEGASARHDYFRSVHFLEKRGGRWQVVSNAGQPLDDAGVVRYLDLEWNIADVADDRGWFERNLADDYIGVSSRTGAIEDKRQMLAEIGRVRITQADTSELEVAVFGDTARASGVYHVKGTDEAGRPFDRRVRYIDTFVKRDGRWQIWTSQGTALAD